MTPAIAQTCPQDALERDFRRFGGDQAGVDMRITPDEMYDLEMVAYNEMRANYEHAIATFDPSIHHLFYKPTPPSRYIPPTYGAHKPSTSRRGEKRRTRKERFGS